MNEYKVTCPACNQHLACDDAWAGQSVSCPSCGQSFTLPPRAPSEAAPPIRPSVPLAVVLQPEEAAAPAQPPPVIEVFNPQVTREEAESGTFASNPGRLRPDWGRVLRTHPEIWQIPAGFAVAGALGGWLVHPACWLLLPAALISAWNDYRRFTSILMSGDVCPTVVVSAHPGRVAVLTNLSGTGGYHPVVRLFPAPLSKMARAPHRPGSRLATVAFYQGPLDDAGNWKSFDPEVVNGLVSNATDIQRVVDSIPEADWQYLEANVPRVASQPDGMYSLVGGQPVSRPFFTGGERRALWVAGAILALLAVAVVAVLVKFKPAGSKTESPPSAGSARGHFPNPRSPSPSFERSAPPTGRPTFSTQPGRNGLGAVSVGDKVEVFDRGRWRPGSIAESDGIRFRVTFTDGTPDQWVMRGQLRLPR